MIIQRCREALDSQKTTGVSGADSLAAADDSLTAGGRKKRERGPSFKISNVSINAKTLLSCIQELDPLIHILPADAEERKRWVIPTKYVFVFVYYYYFFFISLFVFLFNID